MAPFADPWDPKVKLIRIFQTVSEEFFSETGLPVNVVLRGLSTKRRTVVLGVLTLPLSVKGGRERKERVDEWHDFFLAAAGAAAVLAGLVFVGVSINLDMIMSIPTYGLVGRALEALVLLVGVLILTILLLVPSQGMLLAGAEVLAVGLFDWAAIVIIQLLVLRNWRSLEPTFRWHFVPRVVLCQVATLPIVAAGIGMMGWGIGGLYWLVVGVVLSFLVAVLDAWVLLIEINR